MESDFEKNESEFIDMQRTMRIFNAVEDLKTKLQFMKKHINLTQNRILEKSEKLKKYQEISKSVISLLDNYPSGDKKIDKYILETVSCVQKLPLLNPGKYPNEDKTYEEKLEEQENEQINKAIQVLIKMLNAVLKIPTDGSAQLRDLFSCENMYQTILYYAEDENAIIEQDDGNGWKKKIADHQHNLQNA